MHIKDWVTSFWSVHRYTGALLPFEKRLNEFLAIYPLHLLLFSSSSRAYLATSPTSFRWLNILLGPTYIFGRGTSREGGTKGSRLNSH